MEAKETTVTFVRCKSCGYVMEASKLGDLCPACGVKRIMFEPDTDRISEKRRAVLNSHIHPIIVHFPQAFSVTILVAAAAVLIVGIGRLQSDILGTLRVLMVAMPFVVIAGLFSGLFDGKIRFRKVTTPILRVKIAVGIALFVLANIGATISITTLFGPATMRIVAVALGLSYTICTAVLGKLGAGLTSAKFPG